ncbi:MAG TPA: class I SAM-dependent methyltransferase [Nocardioidaceae bacterium]|nr:class I SAM-dependent methyltransferase [Nocardioidaceae bacterium]
MDAAAWDERYAAAPLVWSAGPNQFVASELGELTPGRAVDLACGEGRNAIWLAARGWEVTAVDFSAVAVEKARQLGADGPGADVEWVVADALTWTGAGFGLAVLAYLQLPADERRTAVRNVWSALVPGGHLLVVAHDSTNLTEGTGGPQDASVLYTADDVLSDLGGSQEYDVLRAERVARVVHSADEHGGEAERIAWDALVHVVRR